MSNPNPPTFVAPIDDLIEHLKSNKPYGQNEALKLWEALKRLSNTAVITSKILVSSGLTTTPTPVVSSPDAPASDVTAPSMARTMMLMGG
jgi:hypothetical protein